MVAQLLTAPFKGLAFISLIPLVGMLAVPVAIFVRLHDLKKLGIGEGYNYERHRFGCFCGTFKPSLTRAS
jgi:hypothetical protein